MPVLIDTTVWSLALRRRRGALSRAEQILVDAWTELVRGRKVMMLGLIRQELLSGIAEARQFERLRRVLRGWDDEPVTVADHELAARYSNSCRSRGVAASTVDMLICAVASRRKAPIFTTDADFARYAKWLPIRLFGPEGMRGKPAQPPPQ